MIDAIRKVIAAYHDAPQAECRYCQHYIDEAILTDRGLHGTPDLDTAIHELEAILAVVDTERARERLVPEASGEG